MNIPEDAPSVCVEDFCGSCGPYYPVQFWADFFPEQKVTTFGGFWGHIPEMPSEKAPTNEQVHAWVQQHDSRDLEDIVREYLHQKELQ